MQEIAIDAHNIISPLGFTTEENYLNCYQGIRGVSQVPSPAPPHDLIWVSGLEEEKIDEKFSAISSIESYTKVEKLLILSILDTLSQSTIDFRSKDAIVVLSTTKGNIDLLDKPGYGGFPEDRVHLWSLTDTIQRYFNLAHKPLLVSNACISGVNAMILAARLLRDGLYTHALVAGVDLASRFVISGFQSFKAISPHPCKPFDKDRDGINLGEGCASILLTTSASAKNNTSIKLLGGSVSNDANHISGPSRSGDGLYFAIEGALKESGVPASEVGFLNAHGTATIYNDEMESKAFKRAGLSDTPMNSLKGYFGHTLGAAGIIETIISIRSMEENAFLPTLGYHTPGTPEPVNISNQPVNKEVRYLLKTASGFGGCNGAILLKKNVR